MAKAALIIDRENERDYQIIGGSVITLIYDEMDYSIRFKENGISIGDAFIFEDLDIDEDDIGSEERFLLTRMYTPIQLVGLGRAALEFFIDRTGAKIFTRPHDGIVRTDGSHLTGDAPGFVNKMQDEGLIEIPIQ